MNSTNMHAAKFAAVSVLFIIALFTVQCSLRALACIFDDGREPGGVGGDAEEGGDGTGEVG